MSLSGFSCRNLIKPLAARAGCEVDLVGVFRLYEPGDWDLNLSGAPRGEVWEMTLAFQALEI